MDHFFLVTSLISMIVPLFTFKIAAPRTMLLKFLIVVSFIAIFYLTLFHVIPEAMQVLGYKAILAAALGFLLAVGLEHRLISEVKALRGVLLLLALLFFLGHSLMDGASLLLADLGDKIHSHEDLTSSSGHLALGIGVLLHRLVTLHILWFVLRIKIRHPLLLLLFGAGALGTVLGYMLSTPLLTNYPTLPYILESFVGGSLLHINFGLLKRQSWGLPNTFSSKLTGKKAESK